MRSLRDLSGPWVGFWIQDRERGAMRLTLRFGESSVEGGGNDPLGSFTLSGRHEASGVVGFGKAYASDEIEYHGVWDGEMISGTWRFARREFGVANLGVFEIWPESDDGAIGRMEDSLAAVA